MDYHISPPHTKRRGEWIPCPAGQDYCRTDGLHAKERELDLLRAIHSKVSGVKNTSRARFDLQKVEATRRLLRELSTTPEDMAKHVRALRPEAIERSRRLLRAFEEKTEPPTALSEEAPPVPDTEAPPPARVTHVVNLEDSIEELLAHLHNSQYTVVFPAYREANYGRNHELATKVLAFVRTQKVSTSQGFQNTMGEVTLIARKTGWFKKEWVLLATLTERSQMVEWATIEAHCNESKLRELGRKQMWNAAHLEKRVQEARGKLEQLGLKHFLNL